MLFSLDVQSAQATSLGLAYEFHAIAAAVLGGCSLRGGEGSIFGVVIGAALLQVLRNSLRLIGIPDRAVDCGCSADFGSPGGGPRRGMPSTHDATRSQAGRDSVSQSRQDH